MSEQRVRPSQVGVREATPEDNEQLCALFSRIAMDADLRLAVARDPDFFRLYSMQALLAQRVFLATLPEEGGGESIEGVATFLAREGWLEGKRAPLGYLGDLRLGPRVRGGFFFGRRFGQGLRDCYETAGVEVATTAIITSNDAAIRMLVKRSRRFPDKPVYRPWRSFKILNVHFTRRRKPRRTAVEVRRATDADVPAIAALLAADHERREFGYPFDEAYLRGRLERWPGLKIEDFFLAERAGRLVGVTAAWDAHPVKRFRVEEYRGSMAWIKRAFNLGAFFLRYLPLPPIGEVLRYLYLTHVSVADDDPEVHQALIDQIYAAFHGRGFHFFTSFVLDEDPFAGLFDRYQTTPIPAQLLTVSVPGNRYNEWDPGSERRPGFEMALV